MADSYDAKSCNALELVAYRPIEAALRWCNLAEHEIEILKGTGRSLFPGLGVFPQWPCLRTNAEKIHDAILNSEMPHGRDGKTVGPDDHVAEYRMTVRHTDLKAWMAKHYPEQKPKFLFDELERDTHSAISADSYRTLQVDRDALRVRLEKAKDAYRTERREKQEAEQKRDEAERAYQALNITVNKAKRWDDDENPLETRERNHLLTIIGVLAKSAGFDIAKPSKTAEAIVSEANLDGISLANRSVADHLMKVVDAMATRRK